MSVDRPDETEAERADRNMGELLQELRVAQTGVQILFAFLLTMPLQARFEKLDRVERGVFMTSLILSALATACLIAPVAHHRVLFRRRVKDWLVHSANRMALAGLALLALAISSAVQLVLDLVMGRAASVGIAGALALVLVVVWWGVPLARRAEAERREEDG